MRPLCIVEGEVTRQRRPCFTNAVVGPQIDLFMFHRPPKALDKNVVPPGAAAIHAHGDRDLQQQPGERRTGELLELKWSSQHLEGEVAMTRHRRHSDRSGRAPLFSPGRPVVAGRDEQRRFWAAIAAGMASEDAALKAGMSQAVGTRLFRKAGGMPPAMFRRSAKPLSRRYLSFAEREEIALLRVQVCSGREVG